VPWLRLTGSELSPRRPGFQSRPVHVGYAVERVALGLVFLRLLMFPPVPVIPAMLNTYLFTYRRCAITLATDSVVK
jgi:hypothetical protein